MAAEGTLFGWAFGDPGREADEAYLGTLRGQALENALQEAERKGVEADAATAVYTVVDDDGSLLNHGESGRGRVVVRCTIRVSGPGAADLHAEGPMNG
ncbi:hypothetical protein D477_008693 [Arthrobacter crystallopoietes BAB-32]|uniref:Uncharacterized protein n=1 Tax=Arthrobacter crystallopoietes BAB-32 TaxID=1246476 RepID=N1UW54_9MICC|nr:hypothetical protein [Arthrobacter crystallopoietes]EMY34636.1 hypothetical protein D477_008693 [Arthrobacter crystallopoietes BAB-32]